MARGPFFTEVCYGIIGILLDDAYAVFALTEQRICERMVKNGWLTRREIDIPQRVGSYTYSAKFTNFVPTDAGMELYTDLNQYVVIKDNLAKMKKAVRAEEKKQYLQKRLVKMDKA